MLMISTDFGSALTSIADTSLAVITASAYFGAGASLH
jgi:hypothetical protein